MDSKQLEYFVTSCMVPHTQFVVFVYDFFVYIFVVIEAIK